MRPEISGPEGIGILGIGTHLPPEVRHNDWWPAATVARWNQARAAQLAAVRAAPPPAPTAPGVAMVLRAMAEQTDHDPFRGVVERRVLAAGATATDMEAAAAEAALARAELDRREVDVLLLHSAVPEYLLANTACVLHHRLGLPTACLAMEAQASAYSFLAQLALAEALVAAGRARHVLLVQSSAASRLIDRDDPTSPAFGDAATAVVVGRVGAGRGVLAAVHRADGRCPSSLVASVPGGRWYDGRSVLHLGDPVGERKVILDTVDQGHEVIGAVLAAGGHAADQVDFFAVHQGTPWLRRLTQEHAGLARARSVDLFARTGYLFAASLPLVLATGAEQGLLAAGDLVVLFGGGTGITYGASLVRWGR